VKTPTEVNPEPTLMVLPPEELSEDVVMAHSVVVVKDIVVEEVIATGKVLEKLDPK